MGNNDPVRRFLESVWDCEAKVEQKRERAKELEAKCCRLTTPMAAMPRGGGSDHEELLAVWADARTRELEAAKQAEAQRERVEEFISLLENPVHREILSLRYLGSCDWKSVQKKMKKAGHYYSERHIYRLHEMALEEAEKIWRK